MTFMLGALGNGYGCTVGIVIGICRIEFVGLNAFQTLSDGNIHLAGHNVGVKADSLRSGSAGGLCDYSTALDVHGTVIGTGIVHKPNARVMIPVFCDQSACAAALTVDIKRCAAH